MFQICLFLLLIKYFLKKTILLLKHNGLWQAEKHTGIFLWLIPIENENHLTRMGFELFFKLDVVFYKDPLEIINEHYVLQMGLLKASLSYICNLFFNILLHFTK